MDKIDKIEYQDNYVFLYINIDFKYCISQRIFKAHRLYEGQNLSFNDYLKTIEEDVYKEALYKVGNYLSIRDRSAGEIRQYLLKKHYQNSITDKVLQKLQAESLINDYKFAKNWVMSRANSAYGKNRIVTELVNKGISKLVIEKALIYCDYQNIELNNAIAIAQKYISKYEKPYDYKTKQKTIQALIRKGYNYNIANEALKSIV